MVKPCMSLGSSKVVLILTPTETVCTKQDVWLTQSGLISTERVRGGRLLLMLLELY